MAFEPKQWKYDDDVTEQELNRIEQGIVEANQKADQNASALAAHLNEIATKDKLGHVKIGNGLHIDQNGVLSLARVELYDKGTEFVNWVLSDTGTAQKHETYILLKSVGGDGHPDDRQAFMETEVELDFSKISFLYAEIIADANYYNNDTTFYIMDGENILAVRGIVSSGTYSNKRVIGSFDVRTISGQYKLRIRTAIASSRTDHYNQAKIVSVWGER